MLMFSSTFSCQLMFTFALPLTLVVTETCQSFVQSLTSKAQSTVSGRGEVVLVQNSELSAQKLYDIFSSYLLVQLLKVRV